MIRMIRLVQGALCLLLLARSGIAGSNDEDVIYRYTGKDGGTVYVNGLRRIPSAFQQEALQVDLSHISLNGPVAEDLRRIIDVQYESVLASDECRLERGGVGGWLKQAWDEQAHWIIVGLSALGLLFATPFILRSVDAGRWGRTLMWILPLLAMLGALTTVGLTTRKSLKALAGACDRSVNQAIPATGASPTSRKLQVIRQYRAIMGQREARVDRAVQQ